MGASTSITSVHSHLIYPSNALAVGFAPDPILGLYATNASLPLAQAQGIRDIYQWGLYSYCGYLTSSNGTGPVSSGNGTCSNSTAGTQFLPYDQITADMASNYSMFTGSIITGTLFREDSGLGTHTKQAYYCLIVGTVLLFVSLLLCVPPLPPNPQAILTSTI